MAHEPDISLAAVSSPLSPWRRLMGAWRRSKHQESDGRWQPTTTTGGGALLASALGIIRAERERWAGTQRTICTEAELEDRYFIRNELGHGSFGTVYRVIRMEDAEELAVKVIELSGSEELRAQAINECALWQRISSPYHPSILPLVEVVEVVGTASLHLITELMQWGNLNDALHDAEVDTSEQSARLIMIQLTSAVAHLHSVHSIAHRDIKPENVLCEGPDPTLPGCLKLCDFGCCKHFASLTEPTFHDALGTVNYLSPELAASFLSEGDSEQPYCGPAADCWALGIVCYEILHGGTPFGDSRKYPTDDEKLAAIASPLVEGSPVKYPDASFRHVSKAGRAFMERLLTRAYTDRATVEEALGMSWLQPVDDKAAREAMAETTTATSAEGGGGGGAAPPPAGLRGKRLLQAAVGRLVLANRWIGGGAISATSAKEPLKPSTTTTSSFKRRRPPPIHAPDLHAPGDSSRVVQPQQQQLPPETPSSFSASFKRDRVGASGASSSVYSSSSSDGAGTSSVLGSMSFKRVGAGLASSFKRRQHAGGGSPAAPGQQQHGSDQGGGSSASFRNKWKADAAANAVLELVAAVGVVGVDPISHYAEVYASPQRTASPNGPPRASPSFSAAALAVPPLDAAAAPGLTGPAVVVDEVEEELLQA